MLYELKSVASYIDSETMIVYPKYDERAQFLYGKLCDERSGVYYSNTTDEFNNALNSEDHKIIHDLFMNKLKVCLS